MWNKWEIYSFKIIISFYYSQDTEMPILLMKGSWEVQLVKVFDVGNFATEDEWSMVVEWGLLVLYQKQDSGCSAPFSCFLLLVASVPLKSVTWQTGRQSGVLGGRAGHPQQNIEITQVGLQISSLCPYFWSSLHYIFPGLLREGFCTTSSLSTNYC